jgi:hypothetical protein
MDGGLNVPLLAKYVRMNRHVPNMGRVISFQPLVKGKWKYRMPSVDNSSRFGAGPPAVIPNEPGNITHVSSARRHRCPFTQRPHVSGLLVARRRCAALHAERYQALIRQVGPVVDGVFCISPLEHVYVLDGRAANPLVDRGS